MDVKCKWVSERKGDYLDRSLAGRDREALKAHLDGCEACRESLASTRELVDRLAEMDDVALPAGFSQRLSARLHQEAEAMGREPAPRKAGSGRRWWADLFRPLGIPVRPLAATAAGITMLLAGFLMIGQQGSPSRPAGGAQTASASPTAAPLAMPVSVGLGGQAVVRIWFESPQAVENVRFSLALPPGLRMVSGDRMVDAAVLEWEGSLKQGRNLIPLRVRGIAHGDWTVTAAVEKGGARQEKTIGLRVAGI